MTEWFHSLKGKLKTHQIVGFDIEGIGGEHGFLCGAIVGEYIYEFFTDQKTMLEALLDYGVDGFRPYSHNLQYDLPILEGGTFPRGDMLFTRGGLLWSDYHHHGRRVRLYDSQNLFPRLSVAALGELTGYSKLDLDRELMRRIVAGTPWNSFNPQDQERIRKYCCRDAEIVFSSVAMFQDLLNHLGANLAPTLAGCSMDLYRRVYHKWPWMVVPEQVNRAAREGYYGGRTENFAMGSVPNVNMYDVTSLYPAVMGAVKFPHPNKISLDLEPAINGDWQRKEGIAYVEIEIPHYFIPLLPRKANKRVFYPYGKLTGAWPILEIRRAIEWGATLKKVDWVLGSATVFNPFERFIEDLFRLRAAYLESGSQLSNMVKLLLNSLYGRFGLNPDGGLFRLVYLESAEALKKLEGYTTHEINGAIYAYGSPPANHYPAYANVFFSAQVTAAGRSYILDELIAQDENLVYTDTDSIITRGTVETGQGLGSWRCQIENGTADMIGPKEYALHNLVFDDRYVAKGVPDRVAKEYIQTGVARFQRAVGIRESLTGARKPSEWIEVFKSHRQVVPKRYNGGHPEGAEGDWVATFPYPAYELEQVSQGVRGFPDLDYQARDKILPFPHRPKQLSFL